MDLAAEAISSASLESQTLQVLGEMFCSSHSASNHAFFLVDGVGRAANSLLILLRLFFMACGFIEILQENKTHDQGHNLKGGGD